MLEAIEAHLRQVDKRSGGSVTNFRSDMNTSLQGVLVTAAGFEFRRLGADAYNSANTDNSRARKGFALTVGGAGYSMILTGGIHAIIFGLGAAYDAGDIVKTEAQIFGEAFRKRVKGGFYPIT